MDPQQSMMNDVRNEFETDMQKATSASDIENIQVKYLGKKGPLQQLMKALKDIPPEQRPDFGKAVNDLKVDLTARCTELMDRFVANEEKDQLANEKIDVTLPGRARFAGRKHILNQVLDDILNILMEMGFSVRYGPDIDTDYYNFEALNFAPDHPARDMQDTFYIEPKVLLRTHTSNVQVRIMEMEKPPLRIAAPGRAYRNETITTRSHVFFQQVEGFYVDEGVTFANLLSTLDEFLAKLFRQKIEVRYRPSYFPFVEPGMEVDIRCLLCSGKGCSLCKHSGWLEVLGAGMIHPEVLRNGGIDPEVYSGYAWGMGVERITNLKYSINDIRLYTENDIRFLSQFP